MIDFEVSFNKAQFQRKPSKAETALLSTLIATNTVTVNNDNIKLFVKMVGECGCTFCPATFAKAAKSKESFAQTQLLALDFDGGISFEDVKARADKYDIPILFAYDTHSSVSHNKFRTVFLNDASVPKAELAEAMLRGLTTVFPEADPQSKSTVQMYFGGKGLLHFDPSLPVTNVESLFRNTTLYLKDKYGDTNYKRKVAELSKATGIRLNDKKLLDISIINDDAEISGTLPVDKNSPKSSIVIKATGEKLLRSYRINFGENSTGVLGEKRPSKTHLPSLSAPMRIRSIFIPTFILTRRRLIAPGSFATFGARRGPSGVSATAYVLKMVTLSLRIRSRARAIMEHG